MHAGTDYGNIQAVLINQGSRHSSNLGARLEPHLQCLGVVGPIIY